MSSYDYLINTERAKENAKKDKELGTNATTFTPEEAAASYNLTLEAAHRGLAAVVKNKKDLDKETQEASKPQPTTAAKDQATKGDDGPEL